jgi:hypothetical protein
MPTTDRQRTIAVALDHMVVDFRRSPAVGLRGRSVAAPLHGGVGGRVVVRWSPGEWGSTSRCGDALP